MFCATQRQFAITVGIPDQPNPGLAIFFPVGILVQKTASIRSKTTRIFPPTLNSKTGKFRPTQRDQFEKPDLWLSGERLMRFAPRIDQSWCKKLRIECFCFLQKRTLCTWLVWNKDCMYCTCYNQLGGRPKHLARIDCFYACLLIVGACSACNSYGVRLIELATADISCHFHFAPKNNSGNRKQFLLRQENAAWVGWFAGFLTWT